MCETYDKENFAYLLETNLRIEGRSETEIRLLFSEWQQGNDTFRRGGTFAEYKKSTQNLRKDCLGIFKIALQKQKNSKMKKNKN